MSSPSLSASLLLVSGDGGAVPVRVRYESASRPPHRFGRLVWTAAEPAAFLHDSDSGEIGLGAICDIRLGRASVTQAGASSGLVLPVITFRHSALPSRGSPAPAVHRGAPVALSTVAFASTTADEMTAFFHALRELLEGVSRRRLLSSKDHESLPAPVPSCLLAAAESGIEATLHSRDADSDDASAVASRSSLVWIDFERDALCWRPVAEIGEDGKEHPIRSDLLRYSDSAHTLALASMSDIFDGMQADIWPDVVSAGFEPRPTDATSLTVIGSDEDTTTEDGFPTVVELHAQTRRAAGQQALLDALAYANEWSDAGSIEPVKALVVVDVKDEARDLAPDFYTGTATAAANPIAATAATAAEPTPESVSSAVDSMSDPDLSSDPAMACLVAGMPVTVFTIVDPQDPFADLACTPARLRYEHDAVTSTARIAWQAEREEDAVQSGWISFADMTDIFLGKTDDVFSHPHCDAFVDAQCLSVHAAVAVVGGVSTDGWKLYLATTQAEDRTALLDAIQHGLQHMGAGVDNVAEEAAVEAAPAPAPAAKDPLPSPRKPSKLKAPSTDLTAAAVQALNATAAVVAARTAASEAEPAAAAAAPPTPRSRLERLSQPRPVPPPPQPQVFTPQPVVPKEPPPRMSTRTAAKLASLSQPRVKVDAAAEERRLKEQEVLARKHAILAAAAADKARGTSPARPSVASSSRVRSSPSPSPVRRVSSTPSSTGSTKKASIKKPAASPAPLPPARATSPAPVRISTRSASIGGGTFATTPSNKKTKTSAPPSPVASARKLSATVPLATAAATPRKSTTATVPASSTKTPRTSSASPVVASASASTSDSAKKKVRKSGLVQPKSVLATLLPSPMPVSSPAQVLPSASPGADSDSPRLARYDGEQGLLDEPVVSPRRMSATPSYDPEQDEDLDFDLDFSGAQAANSPKKAMSPSSANGTAAKRKSNAPVVEEEIVVTLSPMKSTTPAANTPASVNQSLSPAPARQAIISLRKPDSASKSQKPKKKRLTMFGEEMDDDEPEDEDDLDDLFGNDDDDDADEYQQEEVLDDDIDDELAPAARENAPGAPVSAPSMRRAPSMDLAELSSQAIVSSVEADDDFILVQGVGPAASSTAAASAALPLQRGLTAYQAGVERLQSGSAFTSYSVMRDGRSRSDRIFLWLNLTPPPLDPNGAASAGALFWCSLASAGSLQPRWELKERRMEVANLVDIYQGRQNGLLLRDEFEHIPDDRCISLVAEPTGEDEHALPERTLDLVADSAQEMRDFMDAFNAMLQGPTEAEINQDTHDGDAADATAATASRLPPRISVPFVSGAAATCSSLLPVHLSSAPAEPHSSRLLQVADQWDASSSADHVRVGLHTLAVMRGGVAVQVFNRDSSSRVRGTRHFLAWHPSGAAFDEQGRPTNKAPTDIGEFVVAPLGPKVGSSASRTIDPRQVSEVVLGKFGGIFAAGEAREVALASHERCITLLIAGLDSDESLDLEFDSSRTTLLWVLGIKYLLQHVAEPSALPISSENHIPASPSLLQPLLSSFRQQFARARADEGFGSRAKVDQLLVARNMAPLVEPRRFLVIDESAAGVIRVRHVRCFYSFENVPRDGPFGSIYWNEADEHQDAAPRVLIKSDHRRIGLDQLRSLQFGTESSFFQRHGSSSLSQFGVSADQVVTLHAADDLVRLASSSDLHAWIEAIRTALAAAGRSLVRESEDEPCEWMHVTGTAEDEGDMFASTSFVASTPSPISTIDDEKEYTAPVTVVVTGVGEQTPMLASRPSAVLETSPVAAPAPAVPMPTRLPGQTYVQPARTPEYIAAVDLLSRGRAFNSYAYSMASLASSEPIVSRQRIVLFYSTRQPLFEVSAYDLPQGENEFPALYAVTYTEQPPTTLATADMKTQHCISMHELSDIFLGLHNPIFQSPSTVSQFLPPGGSFEESACLTLASTSSLPHGGLEWNLEAVDANGLDAWLDALNLMLPLHLDPEAPVAEPTAREMPPHDDQSVVGPVRTNSPSSRSSGVPSLARPLQDGGDFLLVQPRTIGGVEVAARDEVRLFYVSVAQLASFGVRYDDSSIMPLDYLPPVDEDFIGALYFRTLPATGPTKREHLRADRCMPLHALSDIHHGRGMAIWSSDPSLAACADADCFSLVSATTEWDLHSKVPATATSNIVSDFLLGIQALLASGGKDMTADEDASASVTTGTATASPGGFSLPASPTQAALLRDNSTTEYILETMSQKMHANDAQLHAVGVSLLHARAVALESTPAAMTTLIDQGVARQVVDSMLTFPRVEQLQALGCGTLWVLAVTAENEAALTAQGAVGAILTALQNHAPSIAVAQQATGALRNLSVSPTNAERIGDAQGLEVLLATMKSHVADASIQHQALGALASLSLNQANKTQFASLGGVELILALLKRFPNDQAVHEEACACLRNLGANHAPNKELIARLGGLEAVLTSMRTFRAHASNQLHACGSLWNNTANNAANKVRLTRVGGVETILASLAAHQADEEIASEICGTLRNISSVPETKSTLHLRGVLDAIVACMRRFPASQTVQEQCAALLFNMGDVDAYAERIVAVGGVEAIIHAVETFIDARPVVEEGCGALWMVTRAASAFSVVPSSQVIALCDRVLASHASHAGVVSFANGAKGAWTTGAAKANGTGEDDKKPHASGRENGVDTTVGAK